METLADQAVMVINTVNEKKEKHYYVQGMK